MSLFLFSCKEDKPLLSCNVREFSKFQSERLLNFKDVFEYLDGEPRELCIVDSTLIICNYHKNVDYLFCNYSLREGVISKKYLRKGKGPSEALGVFNFGIIGEKIWIQDVMLKKLLFNNLKEILGKNEDLRFKEFKVNDFYYDIDFMDSSSFYAVGNLYSKYKVDEVKLPESTKVKSFGEFEFIPEEIPVDALKDSYLSYVCLRPSGEKLVLAYRYTDVIEIYDINEKSWIAIQGPEVFNVEFEVGKNSFGNNFMEKTSNTRRAYNYGTVSDNFIYLLYSGKERNENWSISNCIFVFDWDGKPVAKLNLDRNISKFAITNDEKTIYAYDENNGNIIKADLNNLL